MKISVIKIILIVVIIGIFFEVVSIYHSLNYWGPRKQSENTSISIAKTFLELTLDDLNHHPQALQQWTGKTIVINFWATWCEPCKEEMPMLNKLSNKLASQNIQFVGIGIDEISDLKKWLSQTKISYPILVGNDNILNMTKDLGNKQQGIPFTIIISRSGQIIFKKLGKLNENDIYKALGSDS